jgi:hypothetical protein
MCVGVLPVLLAGVLALIAHPAAAEMHGPEAPAALGLSGPGSPIPWQSLGGPPSRPGPRRSLLGIREEPETIERVSGEERGPRVPEPMVFDLVRPLGAKRGEAEVNVLGLIPLTRSSRRVDTVPDSLGLVQRSPDTSGIEWAPEIEYAFRDGLAVELELPMQNGSVDAYKAAAQATFGTAWDYRYIHGAQTILQYDLHPGVWSSTWLYLAGFRFNPTWSLFAMAGPRVQFGDGAGADVELLANVSLFADVTDRLVAGVETNFGQIVDGNPALLVMPQVHYEVGPFWMFQAGAGVRFTDSLAIPQLGFRLIREF